MRLFATAAAIAALSLGALGLAACNESKPADGAAATADSSASAPTAAPAAAPAAAAPTIEGPAAGKWRITASMEGRNVPPTETCYVTRTSLAEAQKMQQDAGITCSEQNYHREGEVFIGHSVCTSTSAVTGKPMTTTTDIRVTGDFNTKYVMDTIMKMDPPPVAGMGERKMSITAERLGDC